MSKRKGITSSDVISEMEKRKKVASASNQAKTPANAPPSRTLEKYGYKVVIHNKKEMTPQQFSKDRKAKESQKNESAEQGVEEVPERTIDNVVYPDNYGFDRMSYHERMNHPYRRFSLTDPDPEPDPLVDDVLFYSDSRSYQSSRDGAPTILELGISINGNPLTVRVCGFEAYFYVGIPDAWLEAIPEENHEEFAQAFHNLLRITMRDFLLESSSHRQRYWRYTRLNRGCKGAGAINVVLPLTADEISKGIIHHGTHDMMGFRGVGKHVKTIKFYTAAPQLVTLARELFWFPYGTASTFCYICGSDSRYVRNRKHCWRDINDTRTVEDALKLLRERHAHTKFVRERQKDMDSKAEGKVSHKLLYGVSESEFVPERTYEIRESIMNFQHDLVKHHDECPARFHGQCLRMSAMAYRIACPFETLDDLYFAKCPVCQSNYCNVIPASFETYKKDSQEEADAGDEKEEDEHEEDDTSLRMEGNDEDPPSDVELDVEDEEEEKGTSKTGSKSKRRDSRKKFSSRAQPLPDWCTGFREYCKRFTKDHKILPNPAPTEMRLVNEEYYRNKYSVIRNFATMTVYEADVPFHIRYSIDNLFNPGEWYVVPRGKYNLIEQHDTGRITSADIEIECRYEDIRSVSSLYSLNTPVEKRDDKWREMTNLNALYPKMNAISFDMEMMVVNKQFPHPDENEIIQIIAVVWRPDIDMMRAVLFTLGDISIKPQEEMGCPLEVLSFDREDDMLLAFFTLIEVVSPKRLIGHNTKNYDIPYCVKRAFNLGVKKARSFGCLRLGNSISWRKGSSGKKTDIVATHEGTTDWDTMTIGKEYRPNLPRHTLDVMSYCILGIRKVEMQYDRIPLLQATSDGRAALAAYTYRDGLLPIRILEKTGMPRYLRELVKICNTPEENMLSNGLEFRIIAYNRYACSVMKRDFGEDTEACIFPCKRNYLLDALVDFSKKKASYDGALVENPDVKTYPDSNVMVTDVNSLYPTMMINGRMCYANFLYPCVRETLPLVEDRDYYQLPERRYLRNKDARGRITYEIEQKPMANGPAFVKQSVQGGITPVKLQFLKDQRAIIKNVQEALEKEIDQMRLSNLTEDANGETIKQKLEKMKLAELQQLGVKLVGNSTYGIYGQPVEFGRWSLPLLAFAVTAAGKYTIVTCQMLVQKEFCRDKGWPFDAEVKYIDTDSTFNIFIDFPESGYDYSGDTVFAFMMLEFVGNFISDYFERKVIMAPEKVYRSGVTFFGPKMYIGLHMETKKPAYLEMKGCSGVRRDTMGYVAAAVKTISYIICVDKNYDEALRRAVSNLGEILRGEVPLYLMSSTGSFKRGLFDKRAVTFNKPMSAALKEYRRTGTLIRPGNRLRFITVEERKTVLGRNSLTANKQEKVSVRTELLQYALENSLMYDREDAAKKFCDSLAKFMIPMVAEMEQVSVDDAKKMLDIFWKEKCDQVRRDDRIHSTSPLLEYGSTKYIKRCVNCRALLDNEPDTKKGYFERIGVEYEADVPTPKVREIQGGYSVTYESPELMQLIKQNNKHLVFATVDDKAQYGLSLCSSCMKLKADGTLAERNDDIGKLTRGMRSSMESLVSSWAQCDMCSGSVAAGKNVKECVSVDCIVLSQRFYYNADLQNKSAKAQLLDF